MSRDLKENAALVVHHGEELDPAVHSAFISLLATQPTRAEVDSAMNKLRSARCPSSHKIQTLAPPLLDYGSTYRWLMAAASVFVCCMCAIASTESWAQVAQDFSNPVNEPRPLSELTELTGNTAVPANSDLDNNRFTAMTASIATIAFGAIVLLFVLGNRYAAAVHSHGLPPLTLPNLVFGLVVGSLAVIWTSFTLRARLSWNN